MQRRITEAHLILIVTFVLYMGYQWLMQWIPIKNVIFHMRSGKIVKSKEPLYSFESKLNDSEGFFKCHRSYIVYIPNVDNFNMSEINTKSGERVPIARGYGKTFQEAYFTYMFQS